MVDRFASQGYSFKKKNKLGDRIIKQLLNSVIAKYRDLLVSRRSIICLSFRLQKIIDLLATNKSRYFAQPRPIIVNYPPSALDSSARTSIFIQIDCHSPIQIDLYFHTLPTPQVRRPVTLLRPRGHDNRGAPLLCQPRFQASNWRTFNRYHLRFGLLFSQRDLCWSM